VLVVGETEVDPLGRAVLRRVQAWVVAGIVVAGDVEEASTCSFVVVVAGLGMGRMRAVGFRCVGVGVVAGMVVAGTVVVVLVLVVDRSEVVGFQVVRGQLCRCSTPPPPCFVAPCCLKKML